MGVLLCVVLLALQALQPPAVVTGVVRSHEGLPAAGVRVYVIPARDAADPTAGVVFESLTQTDNQGRFRLESPPGKYYLAVGPVQSPTYYPGVSNIGAARVLDLASGSSIEGMDFSNFTPAAPVPVEVFMTGASIIRVGEIVGVVHYPDGAPIGGNVVLALPVANTPTGLAARFLTTTDIGGRYRFANLLPGTYHLATGYAERPTFFPGVASLAEAKTVTVVAPGKVTADIVVPRAVPGMTIHGKIRSTAGLGIEGADVRLVSRNNSGVPVSLPQRPLTRNYSEPDGSFQLQDIAAGSYDLEVRVSGLTPVVRELVVGNEPLDRIDVTVPMAVLFGRIVIDGGGSLPDMQAIGSVVASTVGNPNLVTRVAFPIQASGEFSRLIEPGRFRVSLETVPEGYAVVSIQAGDIDLLQQDLEVTQSTEHRIVIRLARTQ